MTVATMMTTSKRLLKFVRRFSTASEFNLGSASFGQFQLPDIENEVMLDFGPGSKERHDLKVAVAEMKGKTFEIGCIVSGKEIFTGKKGRQIVGCHHQQTLCEFHEADKSVIDTAIQKAMEIKPFWESMPFYDRCAIFLKAADLLSSKYRNTIMAATMWGQGKNVWQAEIDAHAELADFWRFNCKFAEEIYRSQPQAHSKHTWNRLDYRPLEGFVVAVSPFNFTAIGGNLSGAPALMGNVVLWKPSVAAMYSNYVIMQCLKEAGLPDGVIQFIPGPAQETVSHLIQHPDFSGLHFTGSTAVFKSLWTQISQHLDIYKGYPRIVGETGGKNMHFVHESADPKNVALQTLRGAFEYQGQKCSACSRAYIPDTLWPDIKSHLMTFHKKLTVGPVDDFKNFMSAVIDNRAFTKIKSYIDYARQSNEAEILVGGECDSSVGYYIQPTIIVTTNPQFKTITEELFGPVLTVYIYPSKDFKATMELASRTSPYGLTGSIFARDREAINLATHIFRHTMGNFYINDKSTGAVVGQQAFGGSRSSGTNDKAGSPLNLLRWVSPRAIKETFLPISDVLYPSNQ